MRVNINLASEKYVDARDFYLRWGGALVVLLAITAGLGLLSWDNYRGSRADSKKIVELQNEIAAVDAERAQNQAILNRPENQDVRDQLGFWNDVIYQKRFSWTQLFSDLEKVMPGRAYVISVHPSFTRDHRLELKLTIGGEKHEHAVELVRKMEASDRFRFPSITDERVRVLQGKPSVVEFQIETFYNPPLASQARASAREGMQ